MFRDEGRAAVNAHMMPMKGKAHPVPLIHNLSIMVDGDTAVGNCVMEAQIYGTATKVKGEYIDHFRRVDGKWLFASRVYTVFRGDSTL
jgi:ketosteroid isomerase-like protein